MPGYAGQILRVDLTRGTTAAVAHDERLLRDYVGGTGLGAKIVADEVPAGVAWDDPANRVVLASGPLAGTRVSGTGTFSAVFKGPMTNLAGATQANGYLGSFMRFCGYDAIVFEGRAPRLTYLLLRDDGVELRDAIHLTGLDTWEVEDAIRGEHGATDKQMSVFSIGPAGENQVRFAALVGDRGHVAAHNGVGAVLGSKNLKAIAAARGSRRIEVHDQARLNALIGPYFEDAKNYGGGTLFKWGTGGNVSSAALGGWLPVKNYTTNIYDEHEKVNGQYMRTNHAIKPNPCWACRMGCCKLIEVQDGPYKGYKGEEPEYEGIASFGPLIGVGESGAVVMLSNEADRIGVDLNEAGWVVAFAIECFERGIITVADTDGLVLRWGDAEAARTLLHRIARPEGIGALLAEGVKRAAETLGGEAVDIGVYTMKGSSPRSHDHRGRWAEMFDTCLTNTSTIEATFGGIQVERLGLPALKNKFDPVEIATNAASFNGWHQFDDSLGICRFCNTHAHMACEVVSAITGWSIDLDEAMHIGKRIVNLLRMFNFRHGLDIATERPSPRYFSTPVDGPAAGMSIRPHWDEMVRIYYSAMGWDPATGRPLSETLCHYGLGHLIEEGAPALRA